MEYAINPILRSIIASRGAVTKEQVELFIKGNEGMFHLPLLLNGMDRAAERIRRAIDISETVMVIGDSDTDGITAAAVVCDYLRKKGLNPLLFIPKNGENGHALSSEEVTAVRDKGVTLIITVDMGISCCDCADVEGIDVIVTDHHECKNGLPVCYAVVDPKEKDSKYPFSGLSGAGVALKLICAVDGKTDEIFNEYCDLVAIGTIADAMPLTDENRNIVKSGIDKINKKMRPAISALLKTAGYNFERNVTASVIGFVIAPRINAAGRIDLSVRAAETLLDNDYNTVSQAANEFAEANRERQHIEMLALNEAITLIDQTVDLSKERIIVLKVYDWQQGIAGIVASRIVDRYSLPCIVISFTDGVGRGSARSIKGYNLFSVLEKSEKLLVEYGGHELAAGITVNESDFEELSSQLRANASELFTEDTEKSAPLMDAEITTDEINITFASSLCILEPFGSENPQPVFLCKGMVIEDIISLANDRHLKFTLEKDGNKYTALYFGRTLSEIKCTPGDFVDVYFAMDVNTFKKHKNLQLIIKRIDLSPECLCVGYEREYDDFMQNKGKLPEKAIPEMSDVITVYRYLRRLNCDNWEDRLLNPVMVSRFISRNFNCDMNYAKLMLSVNILAELNMAKCLLKGSYFCAEAIPAEGKINISASPLWRRLKG